MRLISSIARITLCTVFFIGCFSIGNHLRNHNILSKYHKVPMDTSQFRIDTQALVFDLMPNTLWKHIEPCGAHFDEATNFIQARQCVDKALEENGDTKLIEDISLPTCYVITNRSPDVIRDGIVNYAVLSTPSLFGHVVVATILGFFDPTTENIFVVENIDIEEIYRHELQHYLLRIAGIEIDNDGSTIHTHHTYDVCERRTYTPSKKVKDLENILNIE